jgi:hypothetical protein
MGRKVICKVKSPNFLEKKSIMKKKNFAQNIVNGKKSDLQRKKFTFSLQNVNYEKNKFCSKHSKWQEK